jgi:hypothetical protein
MNGLDYFKQLMLEEKNLIEDILIKEHALAENSDSLKEILINMSPENVQKILNDWIDQEGIDPTEGSED